MNLGALTLRSPLHAQRRHGVALRSPWAAGRAGPGRTRHGVELRRPYGVITRGERLATRQTQAGAGGFEERWPHGRRFVAQGGSQPSTFSTAQEMMQSANQILHQLEAANAATQAAAASNNGVVSGYSSLSGSISGADTLSSMDEYSTAQLDFSDLANDDEGMVDGVKGEGPAGSYGKANYEVLRLDATGRARRFFVRRRDLLREHRLQPRDLRRIDPSIDFTKTSPSITIKEDVLLLNLGGVRAIVTAEKALLFEPNSATTRKFLEVVLPRLQTHGQERAQQAARGDPSAFVNVSHADYMARFYHQGKFDAGSRTPPFELEVLEGALTVAVGRLDAEMAAVTSRVSALLTKLPGDITPVNLEELRRVKQALVEAENKADTLREMLEELMDDEDELRELNLSSRPRREERRRQRERNRLEREVERAREIKEELEERALDDGQPITQALPSRPGPKRSSPPPRAPPPPPPPPPQLSVQLSMVQMEVTSPAAEAGEGEGEELTPGGGLGPLGLGPPPPAAAGFGPSIGSPPAAGGGPDSNGNGTGYAVPSPYNPLAGPSATVPSPPAPPAPSPGAPVPPPRLAAGFGPGTGAGGGSFLVSPHHHGQHTHPLHQQHHYTLHPPHPPQPHAQPHTQHPPTGPGTGTGTGVGHHLPGHPGSLFHPNPHGPGPGPGAGYAATSHLAAPPSAARGARLGPGPGPGLAPAPSSQQLQRQERLKELRTKYDRERLRELRARFGWVREGREDGGGPGPAGRGGLGLGGGAAGVVAGAEVRKEERDRRKELLEDANFMSRLGDSEEDLQEAQDALEEMVEEEEEEAELEEVEDLHEFYLQRASALQSEAERLLAGARDLEESIGVSLSARRYEVNRLELMLSIGSFAAAVGAMLAGIFGMNMRSNLEHSALSFWGITGAIVLGCCWIFFALMKYTRARRIL